jgi:hypothetical protein
MHKPSLVSTATAREKKPQVAVAINVGVDVWMRTGSASIANLHKYYLKLFTTITPGMKNKCEKIVKISVANISGQGWGATAYQVTAQANDRFLNGLYRSEIISLALLSHAERDEQGDSPPTPGDSSNTQAQRKRCC